MSSESNNPFAESNSWGIETGITAIVTLVLVFNPTSEPFFIVIWLSVGLVLLMIFFRRLAGRADAPEVERIKNSIRWSSTFLQIAIIGPVAVLTLLLSRHIAVLNEAIIFSTLTILFYISFISIDTMFIGEFIPSWKKTVQEIEEDNIVVDIVKSSFELFDQRAGSLKDTQGWKSKIQGVKLFIILSGLLLIVFLPVVFAFSKIFGTGLSVILILLSLLFIRDFVRHIYKNYGSIESFDRLTWRIRTEFLWLVLKGVLVAGVLGYEIPLLSKYI